MKVHIPAGYESEIWFYPAYSLAGQLTAVELVTRAISPVVWLQADDSQQLCLLQSQLLLLEKYREFFESHQINALVRINESVAEALLKSEFLLRKVQQLSFIVIDISETFHQLSSGKVNPILTALRSEFRLSLSQFGAGNAPATAVYDNLFSIIRLDESFIQGLAKRASFMTFIQTMIANFSDYTDQLIICGIDDNQMLEQVSGLCGIYLQGRLFPVVKAGQLSELIYSQKMLPVSAPH